MTEVPAFTRTGRRVAGRAFSCLLAGVVLTLAPLGATAKPAKAPVRQPAVSAIPKDPMAEFARLGQTARLRVLIRLAHMGKHQLASQLLDAYPLTGKFARNRTLFVRALIARAAGDHRKAVTLFRRVLANDSSLTAVRAELARTLYLLEEDDGARHHLELLKKAAPSTETARQFDQFIDAIDARRPWTFDAYVSAAPSTNFNNGTSQRIIMVNGLPFVISANAREKSGIGLRGGANASYTFRPGKDLNIIAAAGANFTEYDGDIYDDKVVSQNLSLRRKHKRGDITIGIGTSQRWSGESEFVTTIGPQITIRHQLAPKFALIAKLRHTIFDYKIADYRDGTITSVENRLSFSAAPGMVGYLIAGIERGVPETEHLKYWAGFGGIGAYYEAPLGLTLYGETRLRRQVHDALYPGLDFKREDTRLDVALSITKRDFEIFGLAPNLLYTYTRNFSNSAFDKFEAHGANVTLTRKF